MNPCPTKLLDVQSYAGEGYLPLIDYGAWRVAMLRHIDELEADHLDKMQRHDETDEVFVLLRGRCILFVADGEDRAGAIQAQDLAPGTVYNVKRGVWHTHTLAPGTSVLVVENRDTTYGNSPFCDLDAAQRSALLAHVARLWPDAT